MSRIVDEMLTQNNDNDKSKNDSCRLIASGQVIEFEPSSRLAKTRVELRF